MTLFGTFYIHLLRLWEHLWWFFTGNPWVDRTVRAPIGPLKTLSFHPLTEDCIRLILDLFSLEELFTLRAVSRHLCHLIEGVYFPKVKTLITGPLDKEGQHQLSFRDRTIEVLLTTQQHLYSQYCRRTGFARDEHTYLPSLQRPPLKVSLSAWKAFPLALPLLLPNLSCLTWMHIFSDTTVWSVNHHLSVYLNSPWSTSLVSLHVNLEIFPKPEAKYASFQTLNQLTALQHLFLEFKVFQESTLLPDCMSILGQLRSFSLHIYGGSNTATLLSQLGPNLVFLSLFIVNCSLTDYATFLHSKPTYAETLKEHEVCLYKGKEWDMFTIARECLPSLESFSSFFELPRVDLVSFFADLGRLSHLRKLTNVPLFVDQLQALRRQNLKPGALPRLTSIRCASIYILNSTRSGQAFQAEELFDHLLPLLPAVFGNLEQLKISFFQVPYTSGQFSEILSGQLAMRSRELFPGLAQCNAFYYSMTVPALVHQ